MVVVVPLFWDGVGGMRQSGITPWPQTDDDKPKATSRSNICYCLFTYYTNANAWVRCPNSECLKPSLSDYPRQDFPGRQRNLPEHFHIPSLVTSPGKAPNETRCQRSTVRHEPVTVLVPELFFEKTLFERKKNVFPYADMFMPVTQVSRLVRSLSRNSGIPVCGKAFVSNSRLIGTRSKFD